MGLVDKHSLRRQEKEKDTEAYLENAEIDFILAKLRLATYKGEEFETFYNVYVKLTDLKK